MREQISHAKQLQLEGGLPNTVQEDLQKLAGTLENMQQTMEKREEELQVSTLYVCNHVKVNYFVLLFFLLFSPLS